MNERTLRGLGRSGSVIVGVVLLVLAWSGPLAAQDNDPSNDTAAGASSLGLVGGSSVFVSGRLVGGGDDVDYYAVTMTARQVLSASTLPLQGTFDDPDTQIYFLDTDGTTELIDDDDDGADELPGTGSQYGSTIRFRAPTSGTYYLVVTGCCSISGGHGKNGPYRLLASLISEIAVPTVDSDPSNDTLVGADDLGLVVPGSVVVVAELAAEPRGAGGNGDVDYFAVEVSAGDKLVAMTSPLENLPTDFDDPDTVLGIVDPFGNFLVINDDAGSDEPSDSVHGSTVRFLAPTSGIYYIVVSGHPDETDGVLDGDHNLTGRYVLTVGVEEGPSVLEIPTVSGVGLMTLILLLGVAGVVTVRRLL